VTGDVNADFSFYKRVLDISAVAYEDVYDQNRNICQ
jgi:hypothetical protein